MKCLAPFIFQWCLLCLVSCAPAPGKPKHVIEGSLSQIMSLGYDSARVQIALTDMALVFVRERKVEVSDASTDMTGINEDIALSIAFPWPAAMGPIPPKTRVDLNPTDGGTTIGSCTRNVLNDPRKTFPKVLRGSIYFDSTPESGLPVVGEFHVTFENGVEPASGRTVFSSFEAISQ